MELLEIFSIFLMPPRYKLSGSCSGSLHQDYNNNQTVVACDFYRLVTRISNNNLPHRKDED